MLGANILIADDDEVSARFLTRLLTKEGCRVRVVQTSEAALAACAAEPPDLVLIDLVAPPGHGFDVCRSLKSRAATRLIPVVIVTARSERRDRLTSIEAGCDDFITRPYDEAELGARIRSLVRLKRYTERPYHAARSREEAFEILAEEAQKGWRDRTLVDVFVAVTESI